MTGVSFTSDHLGTINANRNALLAKAQNIRMYGARPRNVTPNVWPREFEGTINGKRAVALINDTAQPLTWKLADLELGENCIDLLDDKKVFSEITLVSHEAVLLIEE